MWERVKSLLLQQTFCAKRYETWTFGIQRYETWTFGIQRYEKHEHLEYKDKKHEHLKYKNMKHEHLKYKVEKGEITGFRVKIWKRKYIYWMKLKTWWKNRALLIFLGVTRIHDSLGGDLVVIWVVIWRRSESEWSESRTVQKGGFRVTRLFNQLALFLPRNTCVYGFVFK